MKKRKYYKTKYLPSHPLAPESGFVRISRIVLYDKLNGVAGNCNWCGMELNWDTLCADHLDSDTKNNHSNNLVGSCRGCNGNRDDGTGHWRRVPKVCLECGINFTGGSHFRKQIYCSNACASRNRPKRGINSLHGTRSRYVSGCRCVECKEVNNAYSRLIWPTTKRGRLVVHSLQSTLK